VGTDWGGYRCVWLRVWSVLAGDAAVNGAAGTSGADCGDFGVDGIGHDCRGRGAGGGGGDVISQDAGSVGRQGLCWIWLRF